jgi:hypothetical protein
MRQDWSGGSRGGRGRLTPALFVHHSRKMLALHADPATPARFAAFPYDTMIADHMAPLYFLPSSAFAAVATWSGSNPNFL